MSDHKLPWLGLVFLAPLVALVITGASAVSVISQSSGRIASVEAVGEFAARAAVALDDLQRERANAANWLIVRSNASRDLYMRNWESLDRSGDNLFALLSPGSIHSAQFRPEMEDSLRLALGDIEAIRSSVAEGSATVDQALTAYTEALNHFIDVMALELSLATGEQTRFTGAFVALCRFHDRYAEEIGAGLFSYRAGAITRESHAMLMQAIGAQDSYLAAFHTLADTRWDRELHALIGRTDRESLEAARAHLITAGYGGPLDETYRDWWRETRLPIYFELSTLRNRFAQDGVREVLHEARERREAALRGAGLQLALIILAAAAGALGAWRLMRPDAPEEAAPDAVREDDDASLADPA
ncbi:hypothetical protein F1654_06950 [Alkalicaulis satelles]|uniref:Nitrate/nitrite sensing protein domain-containing protein n=1 Tax=Alkalicaulis satelles TaxID=2609175 RepID=A0A5M6ZJX8_9PROT|nr:nitrate- and nitrite sensing domain-containing protein [Alkalicaulis satelles]KAA5803538.1 hypothetical protein F1654_06950 [Alkalicaulis satelles]